MERDFFPISRADMDKRGWDQCDFVYVIGDAKQAKTIYNAAWEGFAVAEKIYYTLEILHKGVKAVHVLKGNGRVLHLKGLEELYAVYKSALGKTALEHADKAHLICKCQPFANSSGIVRHFFRPDSLLGIIG